MGEVSTDQLLQIIGQKEVGLLIMQARVAVLEAELAAIKIETSAKKKD